MKSTSSRILSATAASWVRILITLVTQVVMIPIYLSYWSVELFGIWVSIQTLVNVLSTFDRGYNDYLEYEFLKIGSEDRSKISSLLWSGAALVLVISCLEFGVILLLTQYFANSTYTEIIDLKQASLPDASLAFLIQWATWAASNLVGLFAKVLNAIGYYYRMLWWNVFTSFMSIVALFLSIITGGGIVSASIWVGLITIAILFFQLYDIRLLIISNKLHYQNISIKLGLHSYRTSLILSFRYFLDNFKQQGVRLLVAPLAGITGLASFTTLRTGANVTQQGLLTISNPMLPELMRFVRQRDQHKLEAFFDTIWLILVSVLAPGVVLLQSMMPLLFPIWTKGHIQFEPLLFALLTLCPLIAAYAQPAMAIVTGNNLLRKQLKIAIISGLTIVAGIELIMPIFGIIGAGIGLFLAEVLSAILFIKASQKWLISNKLYPPIKTNIIVLKTLLTTTVSVLLIAVTPTLQWWWTCISLGLLLFYTYEYWAILSEFIKIKLLNSIKLS